MSLFGRKIHWKCIKCGHTGTTDANFVRKNGYPKCAKCGTTMQPDNPNSKAI